MKYRIAIGIVVLLALSPLSAQLVASHSAPQVAKPSVPMAIAPDRPVVRVNGVVLTNHDLVREEYAIFPYARQHNGEIPKEMEAGIRKGAMQMVIFEELVYQEAQRRKMVVAPAKMQRAEAEFRKQFSTPAEMRQFMQTECQGSEQVMRAKIRRALLIDGLLKSEVEAKSAVSLAELKAAYEKNSKIYEYGESFAIQTISFMPPEKATPQQLQDVRKRAQDILPQAKATKNYDEFGLLAEKSSEDDYRVMMGDHKAVERGKLAPQVVDALLKMKPGDVTGVIQVDQVYCIVRLIRHIPAGKKSFPEVKAELLKDLQQKKTNYVRSALDKKLAQNAKIEVL
jgi:parvulin-like peptidyl-prolyl isomerase